MHTINSIIAGDECEFNGILLIRCDTISTFPFILDFVNSKLYYSRRRTLIPNINRFEPEIKMQIKYSQYDTDKY